MKHQKLRKFDADWKKLPKEHQTMFRKIIPLFNAACDEYIQSRGNYQWPAKLRVASMTNAPGIWEMTWSFSSPDGRATFEFSISEDGSTLIWRRIGNHSIYDNP